MRWNYNDEYRDEFSKGPHRDILIVPHGTKVTPVAGGPPEITSRVPLFNNDGTPQTSGGHFVMSDVDWVITNKDIVKEQFKYSYSLNPAENITFSSASSAMVQFTIRNNKEYNPDTDTWELDIPNLQYYSYYDKNNNLIIGELEGNYIIKVYTYINGDSSTLLCLGMFRVEEDKAVDNGYNRQITAYDFMATFRDMDIFNWYKRLFNGINKLDNDYIDATNKTGEEQKKPDDYDAEVNWVRKPSKKLYPNRDGRWTIGEALQDLINNLAAFDMIVWSDDGKTAMVGGTSTNPSAVGRDYGEGCGYSGYGMPIVIDPNILDSNAKPYTPTEPGQDEYEEYGYMKILELEFYPDPSVLKSESLSMGKFLEDIGILAGRYPMIRPDKLIEDSTADYFDPRTVTDPKQTRYNTYEKCILTFKPLPTSKDDKTDAGVPKLQPEQQLSNHEIVKGFQHALFDVKDVMIVKIGMQDGEKIEYKILNKTQRKQAETNDLQTFTFSNNLFCSYLVDSSDDDEIKKLLPEYKKLKEKLFGKEKDNHNMTSGALFEDGYYNIKNRSYVPYTLTTYGDPVRDVGDRILINFEDKITGEKTQMYTYILERELSGIQKMMDTYKANGQITSPVFSNYQTGTTYESGFGMNIQMLGYKHSYGKGSGSSQGRVVGVSPSDLVSYLRNVGIRLLDEPLVASAKFAKDVDHASNISYPINYRFIGILFNDGNDTVLHDGDTTNPLNIKQYDENSEVYQTTRIAEPYDIVFQTDKDYIEGEAIDYDIPDAYPRTVFIFSEEGTWLKHHTIYGSYETFAPIIADETKKNEHDEYDYIEEGFNWDYYGGQNYGRFFPAYSKLHINGVEVIPKYGDTIYKAYDSYGFYISYIYPGVWMITSDFDFSHSYAIDDYMDYNNNMKYFKNVYSFRAFGNSIKSQIYDGLKSATVSLNLRTSYDPERYEIINYPLSINDIGVYEYEENNIIRRKICQYTSEGWKTKEISTKHRFSNNMIFRETFHEKIKKEDVTDQTTGIFFEGYSKRQFYTNFKTSVNVKNTFDVIELNEIDTTSWTVFDTDTHEYMADYGYSYYNDFVRIIYVYPGIWIGIFVHYSSGHSDIQEEYYSIFGWQPYTYNDQGIVIYNTYAPIMSGLSNGSNIELKWEDPNDIDIWEPMPATWEGTVIVRKENTAPKHIWDGDIIVDNTIKDQYKLEPYHDENVKFNTNYYYNFMPYYTKIDDEEHPIKFYRFTKTIKVNTNINEVVIEEVTIPPVIDSIKVIDNIAIVYFTVENLEQYLESASIVRLYGKENDTPNCDIFDDIIVDLFTTPYFIYNNYSYFIVSSLKSNTTYSFIIYVKDLLGNEIVSNVEMITTNTEQNEIKIFNINSTNKSLIDTDPSDNSVAYTINFTNKDTQNLINNNYERFIFKNPSSDDIFEDTYTDIPMKSNDMDIIYEINFKDISKIDKFNFLINIYPYYNPSPYNYGTTTFTINIKNTNSATKMLAMNFGNFSKPQNLYDDIVFYDGYTSRKTIESSQSVLNINDDNEHNIKIIFNYIQIPGMSYGLITALNNVKYSLDNGSLITLYTRSSVPVIDGGLITSGGYMHEMIPLHVEQPNYYVKKFNSYYMNMSYQSTAIPFVYSKIVFSTNYNNVFLTLRMDKRNIWQPEPYTNSNWFGNITNECIDSYGIDFSSYMPQIIEDDTYLVNPITIIDNGVISIDIYRTGTGYSSYLYIHMLIHSVDDTSWGKNETTINISAGEYVYSTGVAHTHILLYGYEVPRICGWVSLFANSDYTSLQTRWSSIVTVSNNWNCPYYPWEPEYEGRTKTNWCTFSPALSNLYINLFPDGPIYELPELDIGACLMNANTTIKYKNKIYDLNNRHYILDYKTGICHDMFKNATDYDDDWFELENGCRIYSKVKPSAQIDESSTFFASGLLNAKNIAWIFAEIDIIAVWPAYDAESNSYEYCHFGYLENETEYEYGVKGTYNGVSTIAIDLNNITTDAYIKLFFKTFNGPYYEYRAGYNVYHAYRKAIYEINRVWIVGTKDFNLTTDYVNDN